MHCVCLLDHIFTSVCLVSRDHHAHILDMRCLAVALSKAADTSCEVQVGGGLAPRISRAVCASESRSAGGRDAGPIIRCSAAQRRVGTAQPLKDPSQKAPWLGLAREAEDVRSVEAVEVQAAADASSLCIITSCFVALLCLASHIAAQRIESHDLAEPVLPQPMDHITHARTERCGSIRLRPEFALLRRPSKPTRIGEVVSPACEAGRCGRPDSGTARVGFGCHERRHSALLHGTGHYTEQAAVVSTGTLQHSCVEAPPRLTKTGGHLGW